MTSYPIYKGEIPYITTEQMTEVDRLMIEKYKIQLIQMMENAGRNLAHLTRTRFLDGNPLGKRIVVMAGTGGNGGGALVCARRLKNYGADVRIYVTKEDEKFTPIPAHQLNILRQMGVDITVGDAISLESPIDLIIDGVIGYSLKGAPYGTAQNMIQWANEQESPILSLDAPSGVDTTIGTIYKPSIQATATMTLALPKAGLRSTTVESHVGELYLADISVPPELYSEPSLNLSVGHLFVERDIIRLK